MILNVFSITRHSLHQFFLVPYNAELRKHINVVDVELRISSVLL